MMAGDRDGRELGKRSGRGLFIVRRILEAHRGTVHLTSEPAEGTRFVVRLPKS